MELKAGLTLGDVPEELRKSHWNKCKECKIRKWYAKRLDMHFDYLDCPYDCENDWEHLVKEVKNEKAED